MDGKNIENIGDTEHVSDALKGNKFWTKIRFNEMIIIRQERMNFSRH